MKKTLLTGLLITILVGGVFTLTGCGDKKQETKPAEKTSSTEQKADNSNAPANNNNVPMEATEFYVQNLVPNTTIKELYASVSNANTWTPNLLGELEMATGTQAKIGLGLSAATTTWDIKVVDEEGTEALFSSVDLTKILENKGGTVALQMDENNQLVAIAQ